MVTNGRSLITDTSTWESVNQVVSSDVPLETIRQIDDLVTHISSEVSKRRERLNGAVDLGLNCAGPSGEYRTFGFSLASAQGAIQASKRGVKAPIIVELGSGTGVNGIAALIANPTATYVGYELSTQSCSFSRKLIASYGLNDRAKIIQANFLDSDFRQIPRADVVINENIHQMLYIEPQIAAANKILPKTHTATVFVPHKIAVTVTHWDTSAMKKTHFNIGDILLNRRHRGTILTRATLSAEQLPHEASIYCSTLPADYQGNLMFNPDEDIGQLPMSSSVFRNTTAKATEYRVLVRTPVENFMHPLCHRAFTCMPDRFDYEL